MSRSLQHDINCVRDPQKQVRLQALQRLAASLSAPDESPEALRSAAAELGLPQCIAASFADPVETCRGLALSVFSSLSRLLEASDLLILAAPALQSRLAPSVEPAEELRLRALELVHSLLRAAAAAGDRWTESAEAIASTLAECAADPFPDLKREAASCIISFARAAKASPTLAATRDAFLSKLAKAMLINLQHAHSKVRQSALEAVLAAVQCSPAHAQWHTDCLAAVSLLSFDRAPVLRQALVSAAVSWLAAGAYTDAAQRAELLVVLLGAAADDTEAVRSEAVRALCSLGETVPTIDSQYTLHPLEAPELSPELAAPFTEPPPAASRAVVAECLKAVSALIAKQLTDWTVRVRARAVGALHAAVVICGGGLTPFLSSLMGPLTRAARDDDSAVASQALRALKALAAAVPADAAFGQTLPLLKEGADSNVLSGHLTVLSAVTMGTPLSALLHHVDPLTLALCAPELTGSLEPAVQAQLTLALICLLDRVPEGHLTPAPAPASTDAPSALSAPPLRSSSFGRLVHALHCLRTLAEPSLEATIEAATALLHAKAFPPSTPPLSPPAAAAAVYSAQFVPLLRAVVGDRAMADSRALSWPEGAPDRRLFARLIELSGPAVHAHLPTACPLLISAARPDREPLLRMDSLRLLERLIASAPGGSHGPWAGWVAAVAKDACAPNLVWRAGKAEVVLRLQAAATLCALFDSYLVTVPSWHSVRAALLPLLQTNMDDDDPRVRSVVMRVLRHVFTLSSAAEYPWEDTVLTAYYRELLKRLDDARDDIRIDTVAAFEVFVRRCLPPLAQWDPTNTHFPFIVRTLLVHLDDPSDRISAAVLGLLLALCPLSPAPCSEEARAVRDRMRNATLCDRVIARAEELLTRAPMDT